ncbi:MAG: polysaccharide biosynthesis/export family protein [Candidatus Acidiferrales bacterium]
MSVTVGEVRFSGPKFAWVLLVLLLAAQAGYCQDKPQTSKQTNDKIFQLAKSNANRLSETPVGAGDLIHIDVFDVPELARDVRVSDTGDISLPLIPGRIHASGLTTFELEVKLENLLIENGLVSHPQVSVFVKEQTSQPVSVVGAVSRPMVMQIVRSTSLIEVLADAGGITDDAGSFVFVTRGGLNAAPIGATTPQPKGGGQDPPAPDSATEKIRLRDLLVSGDPTFNVPVYGGDLVSVPRSGIVYVIGAVQGPGGFTLESRGDHVTVLKVLSLAHGLTGTAKANSSIIMRQDPTTGVKTEIPVPVQKILTRKVDDVPLQAGDMLYVPDSTGKKALYKGGAAALTIGSALLIYHF